MRTLCLILAFSWVAAPAQANDEPLVVGVYSPWTYFPDSLSRSRYAMELAGALSRSTGMPFTGRGFSSRDVFNAQVEAGRVAFAIIDAPHQLERRFTPLAQTIAHGRPTRSMVLAVRKPLAGPLMSLKGHTLARVLHGEWDTRFQLNFLLRNQVPGDFFVAGRSVRDVGSALSLVSVGQIDAAFTYKGTADGVYESPPVPLPVFVQTDMTLSVAVVAKVRRAVLGVAVRNDVFSGFSAYRHEVSGSLAAALAASPQQAIRPPTNRGPRKQQIQRAPYRMSPQKNRDVRLVEALGGTIPPPSGRY